MKILSPILSLLLVILTLSACSSDDGADVRNVTIDIPVDIYTASAEVSSRAADQGDPGNDATLKAPLYLYVYAYVSENNGSDYELLTKTETISEADLDASWTLQDADTKNERWHKNVRLTFQITREFNNDIGKSRVYAVASRTPLTGLPADVSAYTTTDALEAITLDLSSLTSEQLKDIYSTPARDRSTPAVSTDNGVIVSNGKTLTCSTVKLYHVAAKMDFTWEIPSTLRKSTEIQQIACTGLPSTCKVFVPTDNPAGTATSVVIAPAAQNPANVLNEGNKWIGRACAYVLQPPSPATVNYTVAFGGSGSRANTSGSITPPTDTYNTTFTGWYRVVAEVK